jgi:hypothetical protein
MDSSARWTTWARSSARCSPSALVGVVGVRTAIVLSVIPGVLAVAAIVYAIRHTARPKRRERQPIRIELRPVFRGELGRLLGAIGVLELGNIAATALDPTRHRPARARSLD